MNKQTLVEKILEATTALEAAELEAVDAEVRLLRAKEALRRAEDQILMGGKIEGKNERTREAHLAELTGRELDEVAALRVNAACAGTALRVQRERLATWRAVAELVAGRDKA